MKRLLLASKRNEPTLTRLASLSGFLCTPFLAALASANNAVYSCAKDDVTIWRDDRLGICMGNRMGPSKIKDFRNCVFRNCRNCPSGAAATRAISAISENTRDVNP